MQRRTVSSAEDGTVGGKGMDLKDLSALELSTAIKKGEAGVEEAVKVSLEQIKKSEDTVHAFLETDEEKVYQRVKEVEAGIASGKYSGPLAGVPIAVKDNICTKGRKTTCASKILGNFVPPYDAEAVKKLEEAGMIILGKTNMDEFAMGSTSETSAFGITTNPWDQTKVPGGSSGGSCAAVAAGEAFLALGSDTGGSIRQPSSYCGVVGMNVSDCTALLEAISGYDKKDSTSIERNDLNFTEALNGDLNGVRVGIPTEYLSEGLDEDVKKTLQETVELMKANGAVVEEFSLGLVDYVIPAYYIIASAEASSNLARFDGVKYGYRAGEFEGLHDMYKKSRAQGFGEEVKRRILLGSFVLSSGYYDAYYLKALKVKAMIKKAFDDAFAKYDMILAPAAPSTAPKVGSSLQDPLKMYLSDVYTAGVNLAGLPAISVPAGKDRNGMPVGLQFIGDCFKEKKIIQAAYAYEKIRGAFPMAYQKEGK